MGAFAQQRRYPSTLVDFLYGDQYRRLVSVSIIVGILGQEVNYHRGFRLLLTGQADGLVQYYVCETTLKKCSDRANESFIGSRKENLFRAVVLVLPALVVLFYGSCNGASDGWFLSTWQVLGIFCWSLPFYQNAGCLKDVTLDEKKVLAHIPLFFKGSSLVLEEEQGSSILALPVADRTHQRYSASIFQQVWYQTLKSTFCCLTDTVFVWLWILKLGSRQPRTEAKFLPSVYSAGLSFLIDAAKPLVGVEERVSPLWLVLSFSLWLQGKCVFHRWVCRWRPN